MATTLQGKLMIALDKIIETMSNGEMQVNIANDVSEPVPVKLINSGSNVSDAIPVIIQNTDAQIDVDVRVAEDITIDTSGAPLDVTISDLDANGKLPVQIDTLPSVTVDSSNPVDVNVTNTVSTNATIQGTPNVNVSNVVSVDDSTPIDTNITNSYVNVYNKLYNDSANAWVNQETLDGRTLSYVQTKYDYDTRVFLAQTTDINTWIDAFSDGVLVKKYVQNYHTDGQEQDVYLTHPYVVNAGSSKCLHLIYQYTTVNNIEVVESVWAKVDDWTFDDEIAGTVSITAGAVTSPAVDAAAGTDVCTLTATNNSVGDIVVSLSGTNASLYQLNDGVTTGSSITNPSTPLVLETTSTFSGASYSHSVTATITGSTFGVTDSVTVETSGTATTPSSFSNLEYVTQAYRGDVSSTALKGNYYINVSSTGIGMFPSLDSSSSFRSSSSVSYSMYFKVSNLQTNFKSIFSERYTASVNKQSFFEIFTYGSELRIYSAYNGLRNLRNYANSISQDTWHHVVVTTSSDDIVTNATVYLDGSPLTPSSSDTSNTIDRTNAYVTNVNVGGAIYNLNSTVGTFGNFGPTGSFTIDELTTWSKELSSNEVSELYNSGTVIDPTTHSASANLERHLRFGDNTGDGVNIYDDQDSSFYLESYNSTDNTTSLTSSDSIYVPASGTWANDYYALGGSSGSNLKLYADYDLSQSWTISFWVYSAVFLNKDYTNSFFPFTSLFTSSHTDGIYSTYFPAGIYIAERNNISSQNPNYFGFIDAGTGDLVGYATNLDRSYTGGWHNLIVTWDSTYYNASSISQANVKAGLTLYYDNTAIPKDTDYNSTGSINPSDFIFTGMQFGEHSISYQTNAYNTGRLDGVAIWTNHLVSSAERGLIYNSGTPQDLMNTTNLTSPTKFWLMEDASDLAYDTKNSASNEGSSTNFTRTAH